MIKILCCIIELVLMVCMIECFTNSTSKNREDSKRINDMIIGSIDFAIFIVLAKFLMGL